MDETILEEQMHIDKRGQYANKIVDSAQNRGFQSKLNDEQQEERIILHAKRFVNGIPSIKEIAKHWKDEYGIDMAYESEKEWSYTEKNKQAIEIKAEQLMRSGELVAPDITPEALILTTRVAARSNAQVVKKIKDILVVEINQFKNLRSDNLKQDKMKLITGASRALSESTASVISSMKMMSDLAKASWKYQNDVEKESILRAKNKLIEHETQKESRQLGKIINIKDIEKAREAAGIES